MPTGDPTDAAVSLDGRRPAPGVDSPSDQASLFALLGDETRLRILVALHEADRREASVRASGERPEGAACEPQVQFERGEASDRASGETASREAGDESARERGLPFSELRRRCGVDDSGQFNYHLDRMTDRLVTKRDGRYELTATGRRLVRTLFEGRYD